MKIQIDTHKVVPMQVEVELPLYVEKLGKMKSDGLVKSLFTVNKELQTTDYTITEDLDFYKNKEKVITKTIRKQKDGINQLKSLFYTLSREDNDGYYKIITEEEFKSILESAIYD